MKKIGIPAWTQPALWGALFGAVAWWIALSWGLGWVSPGTAKVAAAKHAQAAVVAYATPACVDRFEAQPGAVAAWKTLKKSEDWSRPDAISKGGWVAMPGQKIDPLMGDAIANACASRLVALKQMDGIILSQK